MEFKIRRTFHGMGVILVIAMVYLVPFASAMAQEQPPQQKADSIMKNDHVSVAEKDHQLVLEMQKIFEKFPDKFSDDIKSKFFVHQVAVGMDPYLAHLAAGAFSFKVDADPLKWPLHADPQQVMWAQAMHPDNSKIWMTFENDTQFPREGVRKFLVYIENGRVKTIQKI